MAPRIVECSHCNGERILEHPDGGYDPRDGSPTGWSERCPSCNGTGEEEIEDAPIDLDDLDELSPVARAVASGIRNAIAARAYEVAEAALAARKTKDTDT